MTKTIAFIGAGNITQHLIRGLINKNYPAHNIIVSNPSEGKLINLKNVFGINVHCDNKEAINKADILIIAVKAQKIVGVIEELKSIIREKNLLVISLVGGVDLTNLKLQLGENISIVRAMPNIAASVNQSATVLCANDTLSNEQTTDVKYIFSQVGEVYWDSNETRMSAYTALAGCSTAYILLTMEALRDAAQNIGLDKKTAHEISLQVTRGAVEIARTSNDDIPELRRQVTTPNGVTERGIQYLLNHPGNIVELFVGALKNAKARSEQLTKIISDASAPKAKL